MAKLIGTIIGWAINIVMIPFVVIIAIPMGVLKAIRAQNSRPCFTDDEQTLLAKAQALINITDFAVDKNLLNVSKGIEKARREYQTLGNNVRSEISFSSFVLPKIEACHVEEWGNVIAQFKLNRVITLSRFNNPESQRRLKDPNPDNLMRVLGTFIEREKRRTGVSPKTILVDDLFHFVIAEELDWKEGIRYFKNTEIVPVFNCPDGLSPEPIGPVPKHFTDNAIPVDPVTDDEIPF